MRRRVLLLFAALLAAKAFAEPKPRIDLDKLKRQGQSKVGTDPFGTPPKPPKPKAKPKPPVARFDPPPPVIVPPPPPQAPPLPFAYLGKMIDGDMTTVFLTQKDRTHIVRLGDVIENQYKLETIDERKVTFTYLPLQQTQQLILDKKN